MIYLILYIKGIGISKYNYIYIYICRCAVKRLGRPGFEQFHTMQIIPQKRVMFKGLSKIKT